MKKLVYRLPFTVYRVVVIALLLLTTYNLQLTTAMAQEVKPLKRGFPGIAWLKDKIDVSCGVTQEYDDNIFLEERDEHWDYKTIITPAIYFEQQWDKAYLGLGHQVEATYFLDYAAWIITQQSDAELKWTINPRWSMGIKDTHIHAGQTWVPTRGTTAADDRILRLGFNINTLLAQNKFKLTDELTLTNEYQLDYINFTDPNQDTFIDRNSDEGRTILEYAFTPDTTGLLGYAYRWVGYHAFEADTKDFSSNKAQIGLTHKFPRLFTANVTLEEEWRSFYEGENDSNLNLRAGITSAFSRYTSVGLRYSHNLGDSSRSEFRQYKSDRLSANLRHYLEPKTILFLSAGYERQFYDEGDRVATTIDPGDRKTFLYTGDVIFRRIITGWLSGELSYHYSKRDTAFAREGHTNNRYSVGLRASW